MQRKITALIWALSAVAGVTAAQASVQGNDFSLLKGIATGEWTIEFRDGRDSRKVCVSTGEELIQLRHQQSDCNRFVLEDTPARLTVQYTCRGHGYGRTDIRRENPNLVQIDSQGIAGGIPFQFAAEARRTADCAETR
ncbi:MAG: hypothetical protein AAGL10_16275 [Pseudomonadota bacterium]